VWALSAQSDAAGCGSGVLGGRFRHQRSPLCALSNSALCTLYLMPTVNLSILSSGELLGLSFDIWKSMKGGLCDKNVFTANGACLWFGVFNFLRTRIFVLAY
jgi:hypothetical protein